jgi:hypothetical protein
LQLLLQGGNLSRWSRSRGPWGHPSGKVRLTAHGWYVAHTLCPVRLAVLYPHPGTEWSLTPALVESGVLLLLTLLAWWQARGAVADHRLVVVRGFPGAGHRPASGGRPGLGGSVHVLAARRAFRCPGLGTRRRGPALAHPRLSGGCRRGNRPRLLCRTHLGAGGLLEPRAPPWVQCSTDERSKGRPAGRAAPGTRLRREYIDEHNKTGDGHEEEIGEPIP